MSELIETELVEPHRSKRSEEKNRIRDNRSGGNDHIVVSDSVKYQIILFLGFLIVAALNGFVRNVANSDEIWNFGFGLQVSNGLLPYRDFNYLQTPLSALINGLAFTIFGKELVVMRAMGALLFAGIALTIYRIGRKLGSNRILAMLLPLLFICLFYSNVFLEYSCLIVFMQVMLLSFDLTAIKAEASPKIWWLVATGLLGGFAIFSKQTFGTFIAVASWISIWTIVGVKKRSFLHGLLAAFLRAVGSSIPCFGYLFFLIGTGTLDDFLDMCVYGISTFSSHYSYLSYLKLDISTCIIGIMIPLMLVIGLVYAIVNMKSELGKSVFAVWIYALFGMINLVPLANEYHVATSICTVLLMTLPILRIIQDSFPMKLLSFAGCCVLLIFLLLVNPINQMETYHLTTQWNHLKYTYMSNSREEELKTVCDYLQFYVDEGRTVYVLDNSAQLYFMQFDQYHKYLDLFLNGNLGTKTPMECLEESAAPGVIYLIPNSDRKNTQLPKSAIKEFKNRLKFLHEVYEYEVYEFVQ